MDELDSLKLRYRCPECKNLESYHVSDKKRKCEKCGKTLTEITEKDYHHYKKVYLEAELTWNAPFCARLHTECTFFFFFCVSEKDSGIRE